MSNAVVQNGRQFPAQESQAAWRGPDASADVPAPGCSAEEREMARAILAAPGRVVVASHVRPDGDAVGAASAICRALRAAGRESVCLGLYPISDIYAALGAESLSVEPDAFERRPDDTLLVVDCGTPSRLRDCVRPIASLMPVLCIDHHEKLDAGFPGAVRTLVEPDAGSASEITLRVLLAAGLPVDVQAAEALWVGVATDTGRFVYDSVSPATMQAAAWLVGRGVRTSRLADDIYGNVPLNRLRLENRFISSLETLAGGRAAMGVLSPEDYAAEGCDSADSETFVDIARSVRGVEVAAFVRKVTPDGRSFASLRSRGGTDVAAICAEWGGGGHKAAAGATFDLSLRDTISIVRKRLSSI